MNKPITTTQLILGLAAMMYCIVMGSLLAAIHFY